MTRRRPAAVRGAFAAAAVALLAGCQTTGGPGTAAGPGSAATGPVAAPMAAPGPEAPPAIASAVVAAPDPLSSMPAPSLAAGYRPSPETDEAGLWMMSERIETDLKSAGNLIRDPALTTYLQDMTCRLAPDYCEDMRVYVVRVPAFNASMAPNGVMQVWSGLLLRARNEAQVAAVLGHEIGHYLRRHSVERMRDAIDKTGFAAFFSMATAMAGVGLVGTIAQYGVIGSIYAYGRDQEREADAIGAVLMAKAGYDPREAPKIWNQLIREAAANPDREERSLFFSTHPDPAERMDALADLADRLMADGRDRTVGVEAFRAKIQPWRAAFLEDDLRLRRFPQSEVLIDALIADGDGLGVLHHYKGELHRLRGGSGDAERALAAYQAAMAYADAPPAAWRSLGLLHNAAGRTDAAATAFRDYLERAPDAEDRKMIEFMLAPAS